MSKVKGADRDGGFGGPGQHEDSEYLFRIRLFIPSARPPVLREEAPAMDDADDVIDLTKMILNTFGFSQYSMDVSVRGDEDRGKYAGDDELWELAEQGLVEALGRHGLEYQRVPGEAAFYGPKIDVQVADAIGRTWQLTTVQVDFNLPERFDITYETADGDRERPVMVHRAILGSMERFVAILIEHFAGAFPVWLSPVQAVVSIMAKDKAALQREDNCARWFIRVPILLPPIIGLARIHRF